MKTSSEERAVDPDILYKGYSIDLINKLKARLGFTYNLQLVADGNYGAKIEGNGSDQWNGIIGELMHGVSLILS